MKQLTLFLMTFLISLTFISTSYALTCTVGHKAKVKWKGYKYSGTIIGEKNKKCRVHYDGWSNSWDEFVDDDRITITGNQMPFKVGEIVQILWKKKYYPGSITGYSGNTYCITYTGYSKSWNKCVNPNRIRQ